MVEGAADAIFDLAAVFADPESQPLKFSAMSSDPNVAAVRLTNGRTEGLPLPARRRETTVVGHRRPLDRHQRLPRAGLSPRARAGRRRLFAFGAWDPELPEKTYPEHMLFLQSDQNDTALDTPLLPPHSSRRRLPAADADADSPTN
jgi:hypothetical protein